MRGAAKAIRKWRNRAIFIDFTKIKVTGIYETGEAPTHTNVPSSFLRNPIPKMNPQKGASVRRLSITEVLSGTLSIFCFVIFVYIKMLSLEVSGQEATSQLETYSALSLVIGTTFFVTLMTSMIFRKLFPGET
jgi:cell division septal protein FtsQ